MISKEEIKEVIILMGSMGKQQVEIQRYLAERGFDRSKERIRQLMKKYKVWEENLDKQKELADNKACKRVQDKAGSFKVQDVGSLKYAACRQKFYTKRSNAEREGRVFDLEFADVVWPDVCPVLGIPLDYFSNTAGRNDNGVSFDQIDPGKGYVKGNVMVMSWRANRIKNDGTADEHRRIAEFMELDFEEVFNGIEARLAKQRQEERDNWDSIEWNFENIHNQCSFQAKRAVVENQEENSQRKKVFEKTLKENQRKKEIMDLLATGYKVCCTCGGTLPVEDFHKDSKTLTGLSGECKSCKKEYNKQYRKGNTERIDNDCEEREQERKAS
jgi:hypothetical protein